MGSGLLAQDNLAPVCNILTLLNPEVPSFLWPCRIFSRCSLYLFFYFSFPIPFAFFFLTPFRTWSRTPDNPPASPLQCRGWRIIGMHRNVTGWARRTKFTLVLLFWLSNYRSIGPQEIKISQESLVRRNLWGCQRRSLSPGYLQLVKGLAGNSGWDGDGQGHNLARLFGYIYLVSYLNLPSYQNLQVILATGLGVTACALASQIHPPSRNQLKEPK